MNRKGFVNITLVVVVVILVGIVGYFVFVKKPEPVVQQLTPISVTLNTPAPTSRSQISPQPSPHKFTVIEDDGTLISSGFSQSDVGIIAYEGIDTRKIIKKFYANNPDVYDFLVIYTAFQPKNVTPSNEIVKNTIRGIGFPLFEIVPPYPSSKLVQKIFMANIDNIDLANPNPHFKILFEEMSHLWLVYIGDVSNCVDPNAGSCKKRTGFKINRDGAHWDDNVNNFVRDENGKIFSPPQSSSGSPWQENNGFCTTSNIDYPFEVRFNSLELYLMGLTPRTAVEPLNWYEFGEWTAQGRKCTKRTLSVDNVINMVGPRDPAYPNAQRNFSVAFILLTKKEQTITQNQIDKMNYVIDNFPNKWREATNRTSTIYTSR